jgi:hypothetical protein
MTLASRRLGRNPIIIKNMEGGEARLAVTGYCDGTHRGFSGMPLNSERAASFSTVLRETRQAASLQTVGH